MTCEKGPKGLSYSRSTGHQPGSWVWKPLASPDGAVWVDEHGGTDAGDDYGTWDYIRKPLRPDLWPA
jgi:hypothetical protein